MLKIGTNASASVRDATFRVFSTFSIVKFPIHYCIRQRSRSFTCFHIWNYSTFLTVSVSCLCVYLVLFVLCGAHRWNTSPGRRHFSETREQRERRVHRELMNLFTQYMQYYTSMCIYGVTHSENYSVAENRSTHTHTRRNILLEVGSRAAAWHLRCDENRPISARIAHISGFCRLVAWVHYWIFPGHSSGTNAIDFRFVDFMDSPLQTQTRKTNKRHCSRNRPTHDAIWKSDEKFHKLF